MNIFYFLPNNKLDFKKAVVCEFLTRFSKSTRNTLCTSFQAVKLSLEQLSVPMKDGVENIRRLPSSRTTFEKMETSIRRFFAIGFKQAFFARGSMLQSGRNLLLSAVAFAIYA